VRHARDCSVKANLLSLGRGANLPHFKRRGQSHPSGRVVGRLTRMVMFGFAFLTIPMPTLAGWWQSIVSLWQIILAGRCNLGRLFIIGMVSVPITEKRISYLFSRVSTKAKLNVLIVTKSLPFGEIAAKRMSQGVLL